MRDFHQPGRSLVYASNGMCATSHPLAAKTAIDTLQAGGNAVDAAIAGAVLLGICEPQMTGIGGDCFALIHEPGKPIVGINGSGRAPSGISADALRDAGHSQMPVYDAPSVTIPGAIDAMCKMSDNWGKLGLDQLLAPAIHYAQEGVPVAPRVAFDWAECKARLAGRKQSHAQLMFSGEPPKPGAVFRAPGQAKALRRIAEHGRAGFYEGEVAQDMCAALQAEGGTHTQADFAATKTDQVDPITGTYRGHELIELPPNGQGAVAITILNILSQFDLAAMDPLGAQRAHIEAEATKLAYNTRDRMMGETTPRLDHMLSMDTAKQLAALIDPDKAMTHVSKISEAVHKDTIYITVIDRDRMAVSLIYSIYHSFGSGIVSPKFGIVLHNRGAGFNLTPGHPNEVGPGKRPVHTIIPGMLKSPDGALMPFGVMGGAYQPNGHARFVSNVVDYGMDPQTAIDAPRSFSDDGTLKLERGYGRDTAATLADMGHKIEVPDTPIGGAQAIKIEGDVLVGASDPRKDGAALGY